MAGFVLVLLGIGIWAQTTWAFLTIRVIKVVTLALAAVFTSIIVASAEIEKRTVEVLTLLFCAWAGSSALIWLRRA